MLSTGVPLDNQRERNAFISSVFFCAELQISYATLTCQQPFLLLAGVHSNLHKSTQGFWPCFYFRRAAHTFGSCEMKHWHAGIMLIRNDIPQMKSTKAEAKDGDEKHPWRGTGITEGNARIFCKYYLQRRLLQSPQWDTVTKQGLIAALHWIIGWHMRQLKPFLP